MSENASETKLMAIDGIVGAVFYSIADMFLYMGTEVLSEDKTALWKVPEWRLMTSMWIGVIGSLFMIIGFISLYRLYRKAFGNLGRLLIIPSFLFVGAILYMHYTLGVYSPLTYMSALKAGIPENQAIMLINNASAYMEPLNVILIIMGYFTELVLVVGVLIGKINIKKRVLLYMYGGYALIFGLFMLIGWLTGEWGFVGSLESLFETTFFIPALVYFRKLE